MHTITPEMLSGLTGGTEASAEELHLETHLAQGEDESRTGHPHLFRTCESEDHHEDRDHEDAQ